MVGAVEGMVMKKLLIEPAGWPCSLAQCPPGFFVFNERLCLKSEYGIADAYCESGEIFWGGAKTDEERLALQVQPVTYAWKEES